MYSTAVYKENTFPEDQIQPVTDFYFSYDEKNRNAKTNKTAVQKTN